MQKLALCKTENFLVEKWNKEEKGNQMLNVKVKIEFRMHVNKPENEYILAWMRQKRKNEKIDKDKRNKWNSSFWQ